MSKFKCFKHFKNNIISTDKLVLHIGNNFPNSQIPVQSRNKEIGAISTSSSLVLISDFKQLFAQSI